MLGSSNHWTDMAGHPEFVIDGNKVTRRYERARRATLISPLLAYLGLELQDWGGSSWLVVDHGGQGKEVYRLIEIWAAAAELAGRICDPLDPAFLDYLAKVEA